VSGSLEACDTFSLVLVVLGTRWVGHHIRGCLFPTSDCVSHIRRGSFIQTLPPDREALPLTEVGVLFSSLALGLVLECDLNGSDMVFLL